MANFGVCYRYDHRSEIQNQWEFVLSNYGLLISDVWVRGAPENWESYLEAPKIELADSLPVGRSLVLMAHQEARDLPGLVSLETYVHPSDAIYIFGADNVILTQVDDLGERNLTDRVFIPTIQHEMYSYVAAAITFYDRMAKGG